MRKKLFAAIAALTAGVILIMGYLAYAAGDAIAKRQTDRQLAALGAAVTTALAREEPEDPQEFLGAYRADDQLRLTLTDAQGKVVADTDADASQMDGHERRPEIAKALAGEVGVHERFSATEQVTMRYRASPLPGGGVLRLAFPVEALDHYVGDVLAYVLYACLAALALALLFSWLITRGIARPIEAWAAWASAAAREPGAAREPPRYEFGRSDPVGQLGERLRASLGELAEANQRMDALLSGMAGGLIATDREGRIRWMNRQALSLFSIRRVPTGMDVAAATQQRGLGDLLAEGGTREITVRDRTLIAHPTALEDGFLLWLDDVTSFRGLEAQRREFAASASHELKTPLAAIQGAADALRRKGIPGGEEYLAIIDGEIAWLGALTRDLLTLTKVESMLTEYEAESVPVAELLGDVARSLLHACQEKGVTIQVDASPGAVRASYARMRQLAGNLMANAVQYNRPGGRVKVTARFEGKTLTLTVADTGIGIPEGDRARIFERFYRVDKSRSRQSGGTGLGLSIVKHIARLYGGAVQVHSGEEGTTFTVSMPIAQEEEHAQK